jgi:hypothetical protein
VPFFASFEAAKPVETPHVVEEAVSRIFSAKDLAEVPHELDCRGALCRLRVFEPEDLDIGNWVEPLQTDRLRRRFHIAAASQPLPVEDSVPRTWLIRTDVYLELDFESLPAVEFLEGIFASFDTPSAVTACRTFGARRGNVELQMTLAHNPRAVAVEADRDLWNDPIARCLVERLSVHAGRFPVLFGNAAAEISETIEVK